jgi:hypothetical protein
LDELDQLEADNVAENFDIDVGSKGIAKKDADLLNELDGLKDDDEEVEDDAAKLESLMM